MLRLDGSARLVSITLAALVGAPVHAADAPPADTEVGATAEALFRRGLELMRARDFPAACVELAESQRIDPRPGTLFTLAECEAEAALPASASAHYRDYLDLLEGLPPAQRARQRERERVARAQLDELQRRVAYLAIAVDDASPEPPRVVRDGVTLGTASFGVPLPVNPGEHTVAVIAPDGRQARQTVTLAPGEAATVKLQLPPVELPAPPPAVPAPVPTPLAIAVPAPAPPAPPARSWAPTGLAVASLTSAVVGAAAFVIAVRKRDAIERDASAGRSFDEGHGNYRSFEVAGWTALGASVVLGGVAWMLSRRASPSAR